MFFRYNFFCFLQETEEDLKEIEAYTTAMTVLEDAKVHANR